MAFLIFKVMTLLELEKQIERIRSRPLVLLCQTPAGKTKRMSLRECIESGSTYIHTDLGQDLDDLDKLLEAHLRS